MSLYNALFGVNAMAPLLLTALGTDVAAIPRFRDCYLDTSEAEPVIVIHARTGGGNRDAYERGWSDQETYNPDGPFNDDLRALPGFISDEDDDFDCTYADFRYSVPSAFREIVDTMAAASGPTPPPAERWQSVLASLQSGERNAETERAIAVGKAIVQKVTGALAARDQTP